MTVIVGRNGANVNWKKKITFAVQSRITRYHAGLLAVRGRDQSRESIGSQGVKLTQAIRKILKKTERNFERKIFINVQTRANACDQGVTNAVGGR